MTRITYYFLMLIGMAFLLIGVNTFRNPIAAMAGVELGINSVSALNEVRANYGGMQMGIGILLFSAAFISWLTRPALLTVSLITGGLVVGRIVSVFIDGMPNSAVQTFFVLEFVITAFAVGLFLNDGEA